MKLALGKNLFTVLIILLVISLSTSGALSYELYTTDAILHDTSNKLNAVQPTMDKLQSETDQLFNSYENFRKEINSRSANNQTAVSFITPDNPEVTSLVKSITKGFSDENLWDDYASMFQWVIRNIEYSLDSPTPVLPDSINGTLEWVNDFWRLPVETLRDKTGDCEDLALLLTSMMLNYNEGKYPVWIIGVRTQGDNAKAHMAVVIPSSDNQLTIFDVSGRYYTQFTDLGGFGSQDVPLALQHWLDHLKDEMPDAEVYVAFSVDFYREFTGNQEFLDWMTTLYKS